MIKNKEKIYTNLLKQLANEEAAINQPKDYQQIAKVLKESYQQLRPPVNYIRQSISVNEKEVKIMIKLQREITSKEILLNKSQVYSLALQILQTLSKQQ